jgi:hypothetical protein
MGLKQCKIIYNALLDEKKKKAIKLLKKMIPNDIKLEIKTLINNDSEGWFGMYHHGWGTSIRNLLRRKGFGEKYFGINNLDDIYVELIEDTIKETFND